MSGSLTINVSRRLRGFSLIEMVAVIAILVTLMTAGVSLLSGTGAQSRKAGTDLLSGLIEQARTRAITSRSKVLLAIAEPGTLPAGDERCRIGMFRVDESTASPPVTTYVLLNRWQTLNTGIVLLPDKDSPTNALNTKKIPLTYRAGNKDLTINVYAITFNSRGGLAFPEGSTPIELRIAEGGYRSGEPQPNKPAGQSKIPENRLKIGRVTARPYRIDG